jgi:hypothetical protein
MAGIVSAALLAVPCALKIHVKTVVVYFGVVIVGIVPLG